MNSNQFALGSANSIYDIMCDVQWLWKGKNLQYANVATAFDIETTSFYDHDVKQCCMYAWCFGINGKVIRGRTWKEFCEMIAIICKHYDLDKNRRLIIYVHNLSYEFQFFRKYFTWEKVFSLDNRKPIYAVTTSGIEFRCSYILTNNNLETVGKHLTKYKVGKMVGDLNYKLLRHTETPLTETEWGYIEHDVMVVMSYIQEEIEYSGNILHIPLTSTGYVRNPTRELCLKGENKFAYSKMIKNLTLNKEEYLQAKRVFAGGFTHANAHYVGKTIRNVASFDFTSSYPTVMLSEKFPMSKPYHTKVRNTKDFITLLNTFCCMFDVTFTYIRSKVEFEHYISYSKCSIAEDPILDNGRIVEAKSITMSITEQDFFIICEMYEWDEIYVDNFVYFYASYLPKEIILSILDFYEKKTELKGVDGFEIEYMKSKNKLNSEYGMSVTDICRDEYTYDKEWGKNEADIETQLAEYNKSRTRFLYYMWGVWVTAYARSNLFTGILECRNDYVYSDTDSVKILNYNRHKEYFEKYNKEVVSKIEACLKHYNIDVKRARPKTKDGVEKPMGVWDFECVYDRFKTLGAKRYVTVENGELSITIAGVAKKAGVEYLKWKYGSNENILKNFTMNLYFPSTYNDNGEIKSGSGKLLHTYIDCEMSGTMKDYQGNEATYYEASGIHLEETDYTLSFAENYVKYLQGIKGGEII